MAVAENKMRIKVYLDEGPRAAEIFVSPATKCRDIVQRLQRQIHASDCFLLEVWQGCERLVPDNESIFSTLLEWGSDLQDVRFYLRRREDSPPFAQVVNGASARVNGFKEEPLPSRDVLLGGNRLSIDDLKEIAARQQQEIAVKERELKAKQVQLMEIKRKSQNKPQSPHIQQLSAKVDKQGERLTALRHSQDQVDSYKVSNSALAEELDSIRSLFLEKEKELAIAVTKVESLTQQLDKQRHGFSGSATSQTKTHQQLELERLRKELMTRNELNHQQSIQIQSQKQLLAEKHKELFELDAQIDQYTEQLRTRISRNCPIDHDNYSPYPSGEEEFLETDHSKLGSFPKRGATENSEESKNVGASVRSRSRTSRKLETLLEVEEEVSDGHGSTKSSTEDLTQGPGPPGMSRVTATMSFFEAGSARDRGLPWNVRDEMSSGSKTMTADVAGRVPNGFSNSSQRFDPHGLESNEFSSPDMFDSERRYAGAKETQVLADSALELMICDPGAEPKFPAKLKEDLSECDNSLEVHILSESEEPSWNSGRTTPSDSSENSGHSSPSSLSSMSSTSSNSSPRKAALFAVTGRVKKPDRSRETAESFQCENAKANPIVSAQREWGGSHFHPSNANTFKPARGFLKIKNVTGFQEEILNARRVKSEAMVTKNESVRSVVRPTVLDLSRAEAKNKPSNLDNGYNEKNSFGLNEEKPNQNDSLPNKTEVLPKQNDALPKQNDASAKQKGTLTSLSNASSKQADRLLNQNEALPRQNGLLSNKNDTLPKDNDALLKQNDRFPKQGNELSKGNYTDKNVKSAFSSGKTRLSHVQHPIVLSGKKLLRQTTLSNGLPHTVRQTGVEINQPKKKGEPEEARETIGSEAESEAEAEAEAEGHLNKKNFESTAVTLLKSPQDAIGRNSVNQKEVDFGETNVNVSDAKIGRSTLKEMKKFPSPSLSYKTPQTEEANERTMEASIKEAGNKIESKAALAGSLKNTVGESNFAVNKKESEPSLNSEQFIKKFNEKVNGVPSDQTDNASQQSFGSTRSVPLRMTPMAFKPIPFYSNKSANQQRNDHSSADRSQLGPMISSSISVPGQSSLTKITVTPSATFLSSPSTDRPENRSPVPTSKRSRFGHRFASPTSSEEEGSGEGNFHDNSCESAGDNSFDEQAVTHGNSSNRIREEAEKGRKHIVSSVNIKLSNRGSQRIKENKHISVPKENRQLGSLVGDSSKPLTPDRTSSTGVTSENDLLGNSGPGFGSGRQISHMSSHSTKSDEINNENGIPENRGLSSETFESRNIGINTERRSISKQRKSEASHTNVSTSKHIKLAPQKQVHSSLNDNTENVFLGRESLSPKDANMLKVSSDQLPNAINTGPFATSDNNITKSTVKSKSFVEARSPSEETSNSTKDPLPSTADNGKVCSSETISSDVNALGESADLVGQALAPKPRKKKKAYRVSLDPHAVLLDAAVEGELDIVKKVVGEVDDPSKPNSEGITALHNAVCACHDEVAKFLVQYGCDVNSQDSHGWTPLHCAAANNSTDMSRFLIEHGASVLAVTTLERKTPMQCCEREEACYVKCSRYLSDVEQNFGLVNEGRVYALYSYTATEDDELSFECGEEMKVLQRENASEKEWWWAVNIEGKTGYIPRNLLGLHPRISPEV
ncbi:uncharacterized protein [Montipora capricornis]|uniref:uncharacterized protein n=1 Tax=Montipora capricornis TaxID=246305 RepID=UPI0035F1FFE6